MNKNLDTILVVSQLLSGFSLAHPMPCVTVTSKKMVCYCFMFQNYSAERQSSESFYTSSCGTHSEWGRKPCRACTTVYAIKKRINKTKVSTDVQAVIERLSSLEWHPASEAVPRTASRKQSRSTTVFRPLPARKFCQFHICNALGIMRIN